MTREEALLNCHPTDKHLIECIYDDFKKEVLEAYFKGANGSEVYEEKKKK